MDARRTSIGDACLDVVGREGLRALTHHRVDDVAGIARGSTSFYCRRRVDLLRLALDRLYELDLVDLTGMVASVPPRPRATTSDVFDAVAGLVITWLDGDARLRSIARIELFMAASHDPELAAHVDGMLAALLTVLAPLASSGSDPGRVVAAIMLVDGLLLQVLRQRLPAPDRAQVRGLLELLAREQV